MVERFRDEVILARWVLEGAAVNDFLREMRLRSKGLSALPGDLLKEYEKHAAGKNLEVVVREDAVFVGDWGSPNWFSEVQVHETWVRFMGEEGYHIPVPLAPGARADAERIAAVYSARDLQARAEEQRQFDERRAGGTGNSRLLKLAETHFVWLVLGFFFLLIPLLVLLLSYLKGEL